MSSMVDRLTRFGLSEKEAQTYLAVLEQGNVTIADISTEANISTGYVYDLVEELERRGLVVVDDHRTPTQVRAVDPESAIESMTAELSDLESDLQQRHADADPDYPAVELVRARQTLYRRLRTVIDDAESELYLSVPAAVVDRLAESLGAARERGVFVVLLLGVEDDTDDEWIERAADVADIVREWEAPVESLAVADDHVAVTSDSSLLRGQHREGDYGLVLEQSPKTAGAILSQWFNFWAAGEEVAAADPPPLPMERVAFRHGIFGIVAHERETDVEVTVHLFPGQGAETLTGTVVEVKQGLLEPITYDFPVQNTLVLDVDGEEVTVGGPGAFAEDYSAERLTVRER